MIHRRFAFNLVLGVLLFFWIPIDFLHRTGADAVIFDCNTTPALELRQNLDVALHAPDFKHPSPLALDVT
jgi:hypothetical protein